jgi:hypothetical protein
MHFRLSDSVRAFLPALALAFCHGCGGGGGDSTASQAPSPAPGAPAPAPTPTVGNQAPTISGSATATAQVGTAYVFQPAASDPDGDRLTFSATNLPPWASFDATSGKIAGTPDASDLGEYEDITITVADASRQAAIQPFSITVVPAPNGVAGVASLQWEAPPSKCDGSPLDDLAGYRIVYGRNADDLDHSIFVNDPSRTSYDFSTLAEGIWYFAVIAVNANGLEGPPSTAAMKSI